MRALLILFVLLSLPLGWLAVFLKNVKSERESVAKVSTCGAYIERSFAGSVACLSFGADSNIPESEMVVFKEFTELRELHFASCGITDRKLEHLRESTSVRSLSLAYQPVTDNGLRHLGELSGLRELELMMCSDFTDAGLEHLERLTDLEYLGLGGTQVTDAGLEHLKRLDNLQRLDLYYTRVTKVGIEDLENALPDCEIQWDERASQTIAD